MQDNSIKTKLRRGTVRVKYNHSLDAINSIINSLILSFINQ